jgi:hypothetical protein
LAVAFALGESCLPPFSFFFELRIPMQRLSETGHSALRALGKLVLPLSRLYVLQSNATNLLF